MWLSQFGLLLCQNEISVPMMYEVRLCSFFLFTCFCSFCDDVLMLFVLCINLYYMLSPSAYTSSLMGQAPSKPQLHNSVGSQEKALKKSFHLQSSIEMSLKGMCCCVVAGKGTFHWVELLQKFTLSTFHLCARQWIFFCFDIGSPMD